MRACSTCHWCHVMERESFESQEVADLINARFVSIKVDREERPDVDRVYVSPFHRRTRSRTACTAMCHDLCREIRLALRQLGNRTDLQADNGVHEHHNFSDAFLRSRDLSCR